MINYDYDLHRLAIEPESLLTFQNTASKIIYKKLKVREIEKKKKKQKTKNQKEKKSDLIHVQLSQQFTHCCIVAPFPWIQHFQMSCVPHEYYRNVHRKIFQ